MAVGAIIGDFHSPVELHATVLLVQMKPSPPFYRAQDCTHSVFRMFLLYYPEAVGSRNRQELIHLHDCRVAWGSIYKTLDRGHKVKIEAVMGLP